MARSPSRIAAALALAYSLVAGSPCAAGLDFVFADGFEDPRVNLAPHIVSDAGPLSLPENTSRTIRLQIVDPDVLPSQQVQVTLESDHGTATLPVRSDLDFVIGSGVENVACTFEGTLAAVNTALSSEGGGVQVAPETDFAGDVTLAATANDLGNTGTGGPLTDSASWVTSYNSNTAPKIVSGDGIDTLVTNSQRTIRLQIFDVDVTADQTVEIALALDSGATMALPTRNGLTFSIGTGAGGESTVVFQSTLAAANNALAGLSGGVVITPAAAFVGDVTLSGTVDDLGHTGPGGPLMDARTWVTTYATANTAPTISAISDRTIALNAPGGDTVNFAVGDAQTAPGNLEVTANAVPPDPLDPVQVTLILGGSGSTRTLTVVPAQDDHGSTTITVAVSDGKLSSQETYLLTVSAQ